MKRSSSVMNSIELWKGMILRGVPPLQVAMVRKEGQEKVVQHLSRCLGSQPGGIQLLYRKASLLSADSLHCVFFVCVCGKEGCTRL